MRWIMCEEILSRSAFVLPRSNLLVQNASLLNPCIGTPWYMVSCHPCGSTMPYTDRTLVEPPNLGAAACAGHRNAPG